MPEVPGPPARPTGATVALSISAPANLHRRLSRRMADARYGSRDRWTEDARLEGGHAELDAASVRHPQEWTTSVRRVAVGPEPVASSGRGARSSRLLADRAGRVERDITDTCVD